MGTRDPRIDDYIARSADFARPILTHIREVVHAACPDVEETMKWSFPHFMYQGMLCSMASFKHHCAFGFWKGALVLGDGDGKGEREGEGKGGGERAMGQFGRLTTIADLPSRKILTGYIKAAMRLNEAGVKAPARRTPRAKTALSVPDDLARALRKNAEARAVFEGFSPSARREYIEWIAGARGEDTRTRRLRTAIEWMAEGKPRNWKYMKSR